MDKPTDAIPGNPVLIGAIRWDAWTGDGAGIETERTLGPQRWHYRLPFYAKEIDSNTVQVRGNTQEIMDQEIAYAKQAGIDYFAYVLYYDSKGDAREFHKSSVHRRDVKFCFVMDGNAFSNWSSRIDWIVDNFKDEIYVKVLGNRPLVYMFQNAGTADQMQELEVASQKAGAGHPYIVDMGKSLGNVADAWNYSYSLEVGSEEGLPFSALMDATRDSWTWKRLSKLVPAVAAGWDGRPRVENPVSWPASDYRKWCHKGTPSEIASLLSDAIEFVHANSSYCEANTVLIFAWNEMDEGGWIVPNLPQYGGKERLDAISRVKR